VPSSSGRGLGDGEKKRKRKSESEKAWIQSMGRYIKKPMAGGEPWVLSN
jgi:hypothetical protein